MFRLSQLSQHNWVYLFTLAAEIRHLSGATMQRNPLKA